MSFQKNDWVRRLREVEAVNVVTTRFAIINGPETSGSVTLPEDATVVLDDFGGTTDAIISTLEAGRPTYENAVSSTGEVVATTFDSLGNFVLSSTPNEFPVAIIYRVLQPLTSSDAESTDVVGGVYVTADTTILLDGGVASSVYGGIEPIDGGNA